MSLITPDKLALFNQNLLHESPEVIVDFVLELSEKPLITTSFGKYSELLLHQVLKIKPETPVLWADTGYNSINTYAHAHFLDEKYRLNLYTARPQFTRAHSEYLWGAPGLENPNHLKLTEVLKLDPINKAFEELKPDLWFTNIRKGQTQFRDGLDILSLSPQGILKVSPFFHWSDAALEAYAQEQGLKLNLDYHDPIKALSKRECGIHFSN
ncbi:phosphoadenosine phosphosulfate reductase family protein [Gilvibacter sediminis]|uniref:phosphoadenosine phosphosulfate reductase family protein n=1 Tax=Gilvibacter sediminis TaxID=379071 RepID=UPI00234FF5C7|nr:phosphoadenosine phosphosulfate reductase family protein [Gilvibacter sediminis]MDC7998687.1 phosphoadenosine phosphosulfate reductase family protein [Gilvibacter sediminis]